MPTNVLVWQDAHKSVVTGSVTSYKKDAPAVGNSHGRGTTTVERTLTTAIDHQWTPDENTDNQAGTWADRQLVTSKSELTRATAPTASTAAPPATARTASGAREDRHAVATTSERYRLSGPGTCYDHTLATEQGVLTKDVHRC
ncbi:hypothetical protein ACIRP7_09960 [Streptomyces sp. NPDC102270]|uniref:hypothetical protein n=1 Tax=Streptomyces sp. NPDC102270 TaxID=3366150 RepID=UPI0038146292